MLWLILWVLGWGCGIKMQIEIPKKHKEVFKYWQYSTEVPSAYALRAKAILYLAQGYTVTETSRKIGLSRRAIYKWLHRYKSGDPNWYEDRSRRPHTTHNRISQQMEKRVLSTAAAVASDGKYPSGAIIRAKLQERGKRIPAISTIYRVLGDDYIKGVYRQISPRLVLSLEEKETLRRLARRISPSALEARRATAILLRAKGVPVTSIAAEINTSNAIVKRWISRFECERLDGVYIKKAVKYKKAEDEKIKQKVFSLLHSPPSNHGINRTSWRIVDLKQCMEREGQIVSVGVISRIIKSAGYKWKKARKVLTSPDPDYREKLNKITEILKNLRNEERFFSIDEFGPCAIRKREGRRIVAPGEEHWVPKYQRSKGSLIITAALELSTNQVTHFYSKNKNTREMIKLLNILLIEYRDMRTIYLSWDAASWHDSTDLWTRIEEANEIAKTGAGPYVEVVPLPTSAQFLNVIESIFSGLARAVIHNSDYDTVTSAKLAIDSYFSERNEYYRKHPKRAGNKIWGKERVAPQFSESHNCKDPRW